MNFSKQFLEELMWDDHDTDTVKKISDKITGKSRWSINHQLVFQIGNNYYAVNYSKGATEQQENRPFEYDGDEIFCKQVFPVQVTHTEYK